jgi:hypothetical protein
LSVTAQSTWKKPTASMVEAWALRNPRHDVSVDRSGAGGIRRSLRILRMVDAPTRWPSSVGPVQAGLGVGSAQYGDLVA